MTENNETLGYRFDGNSYIPNRYYPMAAQEQQLLEDIFEALRTEALNDADLTTDDEREEAASMAFDGTHYQADFWDNILSIMQQAPYPIEVERITVDNATEDEKSELED